MLNVSDIVVQSVPMIDDQEKSLRRKAFEFARASVQLEGFTLPEEELALQHRYIEGEISLDEMIGYTRQLAGLPYAP